MGVDAGDINGDGRLDLIQTNFTTTTTRSTRTRRRSLHRHRRTPRAWGRPIPYMGWGVGFVDIDNDGLLDLFVANGHVYPGADQTGLGTKFLQRKLLFQNVGNKRFRTSRTRSAGAS